MAPLSSAAKGISTPLLANTTNIDIARIKLSIIAAMSIFFMKS